MEKDITIVTAYFDIGRGQMKKFKRSTHDYFDYFCKWAKFKNDLVVFVESDDIKNEVLEFRSSIGLAEQTTVIAIDNVISLASETYGQIEKAIKNPVQIGYRFYPENPDSWCALYNYVTVLKAWCLNYTANVLNREGQLAWMDFGFNHGGTVYSLKSDFNIKWQYDFGEKITLFNLQKLDDRPIFDIIFSMDTYIMGSIIIVPSMLASKFWELTKKSIQALSVVGLSDDDQVVWLMCARIAPEYFSVKETVGWHKALKEYGCSKLIFNDIPAENKLKGKLKKIKKKLEAFKYSKKIYSFACNWTQK